MKPRGQINGRQVDNCNSLQAVFDKSLAYGPTSHSELGEWSPAYKETIESTKSKKYRRVNLNIPVKVYDLEARIGGLLRDISEMGLGVAGIQSDVGQVKTFQIPISQFINTDPVVIVAECKWAQLRGRKTEDFVAGFEIIDLSDEHRKVLTEFMELLLLSKSGEWRTMG
jgi:hypothetical protein